MAQALDTNATLTSLNLGDTMDRIGDDVASKLVQSLATNTALKSLATSRSPSYVPFRVYR